MNKTKRLLALVICLLLTITSLPVTQLVFADEPFVVLDEQGYSSATDITWSKGTNPKFDSYADFSVDENGAYTLTTKNTVGAGTSKTVSATRNFENFIVEKSEDNRTQVVSDFLNGKFRFDMDLEALVKTYGETTAPYFDIIFRTLTPEGSATLLYDIRIKGDNFVVIDNSSEKNATYRRSCSGEGVWQAGENPAAASFAFELDTVTGDVASYFNGVFMDKYNGKVEEKQDGKIANRNLPIKSMRVQFLNRVDDGSYLKFKNYKITQIENAAKDILATLPETLVENVNGATETSVTLPAIDGVTWASADETTATVSGNTLTLIPSEEGTKEAVVTAKFVHNNTNYTKTYEMTLAKVEENVEPETPVEPEIPVEPEEPSADGVIAVNQTFDFDDVAEAKLAGFSAGTSGYTELVIVDDKPVFKHIKQKVLEDASTINSSMASGNKYVFPAGPVLVDLDNRTRIINEDGKYQGEITIDVTADIDMLQADGFTYEGVSIGASYSDLYPKSSVGTTGIIWRVRTGSYQMQNSTTTDNKKDPTNTITPEKGVANGMVGIPTTVSTTINTVDQMVSGNIVGDENVMTGLTYARNHANTTMDNVNYLDFAMMQRLGVDSTITVHSVKLIVNNPYFGDDTKAKLALLPETLDVADVDNVTEKLINLPEIEGVVWSSTSDNVEIDGSTAKLTRIKGNAVDVSIKGTFITDGIKYSKEYTMTLAEEPFKVTFHDFKGGVFETTEVANGDTAVSIVAPFEENYNFIGWYEEGAEAAFNFDQVITCDINLYAKYEGVESNVVFIADGVTVATLTGKFGGVVEGSLPEIPEKSGYSPMGWVIGDTDEPFTTATLINNTNMFVNAKYEAGILSKYTVTYMVDGKEYCTEDVTDGYTVSQIPENPSKDNYTFKGWELDGTLYDFKTPVTSNITLNAKFDPNEIKVNFYMDKNMKELYKTGTGYYNMPFGKLPVPTKDTFMFLGWKNEDGTDFTAEQIITEDINVYAVWESAVKVVLDEDITKYGGLDKGVVKFYKAGGSVALSYDNGAKMEWVDSIATSRKFDQNLVVSFKVPHGEADVENRTQVYNNKLVGDYEVEVTMDVKLSDASWSSEVTAAPYGYYSTGYSPDGSSFENILMNRFLNTDIATYNSSSQSSSDFNATNTINKVTRFTHSKTSTGTLADGGYENVVNRIRYDTTRNYAEMTAPGYDGVVAYGSGTKSLRAINAIRAQMMACFAPGDYIRIKNIKVTQYNADFGNQSYLEALDIINILPDTIVAEGDTAFAVTKALNIPSIDGVVWTSSDKEAANASTGEITRWYDSREVIVTATVSVGNYTLSKDYTLTIQGDTSVVRETIIEENFSTEADMRNWTITSLSDGVIGGYTVDENGIKISKVSGAEESDSLVEKKRYFAYYDLYTETKSDVHTSTSTKDVKGVYDVTLEFGEYLATSTVPMKIGIGYRNGTTFYAYGSVVFDENGARFVYNKDAVTTGEYKFIGGIEKDSKLTVRIDNILGEIALIKDGEILLREACSNGLDDNAMINTVRTAIDVNNEMGDFVTLKSVKFEKIVKDEVYGLENAVKAADSLTISTVTKDSADAVSTINELPSKIGNYTVGWKSSSSQIDVENGEVFFDATANPVTIIAEIYDVSSVTPVVVRKEFYLTVRAAVNNSEVGQFEISQLGKITNQNYNDIRYNLNIPANDGITWSSSRTDIITNDGKINNTVVLTEATPVTITAESNGITKEYNLVIAPRTEQVELSKGTLPLAINLANMNNAKVSADVKVKFNYTHSSDNTGKVNIVNDMNEPLVSMVTTSNGIYFDYKNSNYKGIALADGQVADVEIIVMPDIDKVTIFVDGEFVVDYAELKVETDYIAGIEKSNSSLITDNVIMTVDRYGMLQANIDNFDYFADADMGYATKEGISLPTDIISTGKVTWTSSNPELIANNGKVIEPDKLTYADVKFNLADTDNSRIFISKTFKIAVDCNNTKNILSKIEPEITNIRNAKYPEKNATDNDITTAMKLTDSYEEASEITFNLGTEKTLNSVFISLVESGIGDFEVYLSNDGNEWNKVVSDNFGIYKTKFVEFEPTIAKFFKIVVKETEVKDVYVNEIKAYLSATKDELALIDLDLITVPAVAEGNKISLATEGVNGTTVTWTSSNENVISNKGVVTRPSSATTVKLTATVIVAGEPVSKVFEVYVDSKSTSGPSQVGGGSGGGGGGGTAGSATSKPVIGTTDDTVYSEPEKEDTVSSESLLYNDVKTTDWYYDAVTILTEKGVISGDGTGKFNPSDKVTREQFVKMILEAIDVDVEHSFHTFTDVTNGAWYEGYVATAVSKGIVNGIGAGKFGVGSNISRQDMAVLIERVLAYKEFEIEKAEVEPFADISNAADYAKDAVANMKAIGLIQGYDNNYYPKDNLTRAEAATVIATLLKLLIK